MTIARNPQPVFAASEAAEGAGGSATPASAAALHPSAETGLDTAALGRLRELDPTGTSGLVERVFRAFAGSLERLMPQLHAAQIGADWNAVRHVAHTLKSSSASVGAIKLSLLCAEIETMIRTDNLDGVTERIEQMERETAAVLKAMQQLR